SAVAIACVIWFGGRDVMSKVVVKSASIVFDRQAPMSFHLVWVAIPTSLGVLIAFTSYAQRFFRPIMDFSEKYNILQSAMAASERIFKLLDAPVDVVSPAMTKKPQGLGRIEFDHVWFAYREMPQDDTVAGNGKAHGGTAASAISPKRSQAESGSGSAHSSKIAGGGT